ncbi:MAG: MFS transporter [Chromatiales bacterium]|nr:MFS transporter [Chromatiales bacterium]
MKNLFYGWYIALACGVGLACGIATVLLYTFGIFVIPLQESFGWSQSEIFLALFLSTLTITIIAPFIGIIVDRIGARRVILVSLVLVALLIASFYFQDESLLTFYLRYIAIAILGLGTTHVAFTRIIALWFDRRRGLALGIALAGVGVGGFFWPILSQWAIDTFGWRMAYVVVGLTVAAIGCTVMLLVVKDTPQSMGLRPDGDVIPEGETAELAAPPGMLLRQALATRHFWIMVIAFLLIGFAITSLQVHLVPLLRSRGVSAMQAANALSVLAIALVVGRIAAGWLMDHFFAPRVAIAFLLGPLVSIFLLATGASGWLAFVAGILTGLAAGAQVDATAYLASRYFGLRFFSSIYAWYYSAYSLGAGIGPLVTAQSVDRFGSYNEVLYLHSALIVIAALLLAVLPKFPVWQRGK